MYKFLRPLRPDEVVPIKSVCRIHGEQEIFDCYGYVPKTLCLDCIATPLKEYYNLYDYSKYEEFHKEFEELLSRFVGEPLYPNTIKDRIYFSVHSLFYRYFCVRLEHNLSIFVYNTSVDVRITDYDFSYLVYILKRSIND